ncbi:MAG: class I SAM-dependent methyltransferase [Deltaproteobacteria bacterium]|nr:class I SAM-dependent methyltransferase [Deltaproteobacteria bacterium]
MNGPTASDLPDAGLGEASAIDSVPRPICPLCGADGPFVFRGLRDMLFGAPGAWSMRRCGDRGCGLHWLDPMPTEKDIGKAYAKYYTHEDVSAGSGPVVGPAARWAFKAIKPLLKLVVRLAGLRRLERDWGRRAVDLFIDDPAPGARLIDVGCGNGDFLAHMRERGWSVEGAEVDPKAVVNARARHDIEVHLGSLAELGLPADTFDAVTMNHVIEHVHEPLALVSECLRVIKPGGRLVLVTPNSESLGHRRFRQNWRGLEPPRHLHIFSADALGSLVVRAGFSSFETWSSPANAEGILMASILLEQREKRRSAWSFGDFVRLFVLRYAELRLVDRGHHSGEEVVLVAVKGG